MRKMNCIYYMNSILNMKITIKIIKMKKPYFTHDTKMTFDSSDMINVY